MKRIKQERSIHKGVETYTVRESGVLFAAFFIMPYIFLVTGIGVLWEWIDTYLM